MEKKNEGQHVSNEKTFLLEFYSNATINKFLFKFFKDKSKSTLQHDILDIKVERSEVDIKVESISVNLKKSSTTGKSINICSKNIKKSVCIKKAVLGSHYQGILKCGEAAGIQCTSNAFIAVCFSAVKNVSVWKSWDIDFILDQGRHFTEVFKGDVRYIFASLLSISKREHLRNKEK